MSDNSFTKNVCFSGIVRYILCKKFLCMYHLYLYVCFMLKLYSFTRLQPF